MCVCVCAFVCVFVFVCVCVYVCVVFVVYVCVNNTTFCTYSAHRKQSNAKRALNRYVCVCVGFIVRLVCVC